MRKIIILHKLSKSSIFKKTTKKKNPKKKPPKTDSPVTLKLKNSEQFLKGYFICKNALVLMKQQKALADLKDLVVG